MFGKSVSSLGTPAKLLRLLTALVALHGLCACGLARAAAADSTDRCTQLKSADFSDLPDAPTQIVDMRAFATTTALPANCRIQGYVAPQVGFVLQLPTFEWNGRLLMLGCGGTCGALALQASFCEASLRRGYACIVTDTGHAGNGGDALWSYNNLQAKIDFAYRAIHVAAVAGKAITERFYAARPRRSYFMGCSEGGRQGLVEAQRFPWDFDGILVGAPGLNETGYYMDEVWNLRAVAGSHGKPLLRAADLRLLHRAVLSACGKDDGASDSIIGNPLACHFDLSSLRCANNKADSCLTREQLAGVKKIYDGPTTSKGERVTPGGPSFGSELNWIDAWVGTDEAAPWYTPESVSDPMRYMAFLPDAGPAWKYTDFDFDKDYRRLAIMESLYSGTNPDLRRFKAAGGKLLAYQGWADNLALPRETIDYYDTVVKTMGGRAETEGFFRLFMLPGVNHCGGGAGADAADFLDYLEAWVERGKAPDQILTAHVESDSTFFYPYHAFPSNSAQPTFTRPAYPYPLRAVYQGKGDPNDATSFTAAAPQP